MLILIDYFHEFNWISRMFWREPTTWVSLSLYRIFTDLKITILVLTHYSFFGKTIPPSLSFLLFCSPYLFKRDFLPYSGMTITEL